MNRKPLLIGILIVVVAVLGGASIYLANNIINQDQSPDDSSADINYTPIRFNDIESSPEGTVIRNQYQESHGIRFSGEGTNNCAPRLCKEGDPLCGFSYQGGNDSQEVPDGAAPILAPGRRWAPNFLGLNSKCTLVIDFTQPTTKFSFDILDIDTAGSDTEGWRVTTFNNGTQVGGVITIDKAYLDNIYPNCRECGDGRSTPVNIDRNQQINQIKVSPIGADPSFGLGFDNFTPFSIPTDPDPLIIDKTSSVSQSGSTATINYTLTVTNPNSVAVDNLIVVDKLPTEVVSVTNISHNGVYDATAKTITWKFDAIGAGGTRTPTFTATFNVPEGSTLNLKNEGIIYVDANTDGNPSTDEENDRDEVTDPVTGPQQETGELNITKTSTSSDQGTSKVVTYSLAIQNTYTTAKAVDIEDTLDTKVQASWVSEISNGGTLSNGVITWDNLTIPASSTLTLTYKVTIPNTAAGTYKNVAVLYDTSGNELDRDDETLTITPTAEVGTINVTKTSSAVTQASAHVVTYTLTVQNTFATQRTGVRVVDNLDSKVLDSWVSNISNNGTVSNKVITWNNLTIPGSSSITLTYQVTIPKENPGTYTNIVVVYDSTGTETDRDDETVTITTTTVVTPPPPPPTTPTSPTTGTTPLPATGILDDNRNSLIIGFVCIILAIFYIKLEFNKKLHRIYKDIFPSYSDKILKSAEKNHKSGKTRSSKKD